MAHIDQGGTPFQFFAPGSGSSFNQQIANGAMRTSTAGYVSTNKPQGVMPRVGFGWDVSKTGALRCVADMASTITASAVLFYAVYTNPPFGAVALDVRNGQTLNYSIGTANGLAYPLFPPGLQFQLNPAGGLCWDCPSPQVKGLGPIVHPPTVQVWNITVEKRLSNSIIVEADYLANHTNNLLVQTNVNRFAGDLLQHNGSLTRLNPYFGPITFTDKPLDTQMPITAHSSSVSASREAYRQKASTLSVKPQDWTSSNDNGVAAAESILDASNPSLQHGLSDYDVARRLTIDSVYDVPSPFKHGLGSHVLGGWQLAGISIFQSGLPFSVYTTAAYPRGDYNADGYNYDYPNTPSFGNHTSSARGDFIKGLFAASAFSAPAAGQEGNLGRNTFSGPGLANVNLNVVKTEHLPWFVREGATLQLRGEIFNLFNRVNLTNPVSDLSSSLFGKSTGQNLPRSVTFGIRIQY